MTYMNVCSPIDSGYLNLCCQAILEILLVILVGSSPVHSYIRVPGRTVLKAQLYVKGITGETETQHLQYIMLLFETLAKAFCSRFRDMTSRSLLDSNPIHLSFLKASESQYLD